MRNLLACLVSGYLSASERNNLSAKGNQFFRVRLRGVYSFSSFD
jgi:hypothetical protein